LEVGSGEVFDVCVSNRGDFFVAVSGDGVLTLFRLSDYAVLARLRRDSDSPSCVATSVAIAHDDRLLAVGYGDSQVALWDAESHRLLSLTCCHSNCVYAVKFVPKSQRLVTGSFDSSIKIWEIRHDGAGPALELVWTLGGHSGYVLSLAVDPAGELLVSGSKDLTAAVSSLALGAMLYSVNAHSNSVISVAFSPLGDRLCTGSGNQSVKIWIIAREAE
jgi:WD40 repeat protein